MVRACIYEEHCVTVQISFSRRHISIHTLLEQPEPPHDQFARAGLQSYCTCTLHVVIDVLVVPFGEGTCGPGRPLIPTGSRALRAVLARSADERSEDFVLLLSGNKFTEK